MLYSFLDRFAAVNGWSDRGAVLLTPRHRLALRRGENEMTIKELIEKLQLANCPDAVVNICDGERSWSELMHVELNFPRDGNPYVVLY